MILTTRRKFLTTAAGWTIAASMQKLAQAKSPSDVIKVGIQPVMIVPLWSARVQGLFEKSKTKVEFVSFNTGPAQTAALRSGVVNLAWGAATSFYSIRSNGAPVQWSATVANFNHSDGLVVGSNSNIKTIKDLAGKKIALPFYTVVHGPLLLLLKANGISPDSVELINLAPPQAAAAVLSGTADAMVAWSPFMDQVVARGGHVLFRMEDTPGGGWSWDGFATNENWVKDNNDILAEFYKILEQGRISASENKNRIVDAVVKNIGIPRAVAKEQFERLIFPPLIWNLEAGQKISMCDASAGQGLGQPLSQAREFYKSTGQIKEPADIEVYLTPNALGKVFGKTCRV